MQLNIGNHWPSNYGQANYQLVRLLKWLKINSPPTTRKGIVIISIINRLIPIELFIR